MRTWLDNRKRDKRMNNVLRGVIGMVTQDTSFDVARFSYVDAEHVEVTWKIYDYFESQNDYHKGEAFDAEVEFVATLDEAEAIILHQYLGPFTGRTDGYYVMAGFGQMPINVLEAVQNKITNRTARLTVTRAGRSVSVMTRIPRTNPGHAMHLLRKDAERMYRDNLKNDSLVQV